MDRNVQGSRAGNESGLSPLQTSSLHLLQLREQSGHAFGKAPLLVSTFTRTEPLEDLSVGEISGGSVCRD